MNIFSGNIVDVLNSRIYSGTIYVSDGKIAEITEDSMSYNTFIIPPLIDSHVHIESSMLIPSEFARAASVHGTVAVVSDPHEIANVLGESGIRYMIENSRSVPMKFYFGAPSCVPATTFETSGAHLGVGEVERLLSSENIKYLSEVMNFPGVLNNDTSIIKKIETAKKYGKRIDGHSPGLRGEDAKRYIGAGITTDHECISSGEAEEKIRYGMKILIREGSAARDFDELAPLIEKYPDKCMLCTDDIHPDDLMRGHINRLVKKALTMGIDSIKAIRCASLNPVLHYGLEVGLLQPGDSADFVIIDNFEDFNILMTVINGSMVAESGRTLIQRVKAEAVNNFNTELKSAGDFSVKKMSGDLNIIEVVEGQLITNSFIGSPRIVNEMIVSDTTRDILKIAVINRYRDAPPVMGFVKGFGMNTGAIASSVAHDSHNIIAVGVTDKEICRAVNLIIESRGGLSIVNDQIEEILPLPIAGLMSSEEGINVAMKYTRIDSIAKQFGAVLKSPFMTLSFMALLVIPKLKISDRGLFDSEKFEFSSLFIK